MHASPQRRRERTLIIRFALMLAASFCMALPFADRAAAADPDYPIRPIRIIVGFPPAGAADIFARLVGQKLGEAWNEAVIIDNRPGAGSTMGSEIASRATPDGYTLMVVSASFATSAGLYRNLKYHPVKSFRPIALIASSPNVLFANPSVPVRSAKELIALAKVYPGKFTLASAGTGSITHLAGALFTDMAGMNVVHVPFKGIGPALTAVLGGEVHMTIASLPAALGQVKAGRGKALGVTSGKRSAALPDVPTLAESGVAGYEAKNWFGMLAPAGVPVVVADKLGNQVVTVLRTPAMTALVNKEGADVEAGGGREFAEFLVSEITKWKKVIKDAGVTLQ